MHLSYQFIWFRYWIESIMQFKHYVLSSYCIDFIMIIIIIMLLMKYLIILLHKGSCVCCIMSNRPFLIHFIYLPSSLQFIRYCWHQRSRCLATRYMHRCQSITYNMHTEYSASNTLRYNPLKMCIWNGIMKFKIFACACVQFSI